MEPIRLIQSETDAAATPEAVQAAEDPAAGAGGSVFSSSTLPGILFAGSIVLIVVVLMRHARRKRARLREPMQRPVIAHSGTAAAAGRDEVHAVVADAADLTRELAAAVESKAARLEILLRQADERIAALERRTAAPAPAAAMDGAGVDAGARPATEPGSRDRGSVVAMVDRGASDDEIVRATGVAIGEVQLMRRLHAASGEAGVDSPCSPGATETRLPRRQAGDARTLDAYLEALVGEAGGTKPPSAS